MAVGERNTVSCGSIEHKMGIRASATAVLNFDNATGYLIGEVNKGLHAMFTFMNTARIGTAVQGIAHAELSFQGAYLMRKIVCLCVPFLVKKSQSVLLMRLFTMLTFAACC
jgi:phage-related holin